MFWVHVALKIIFDQDFFVYISSFVFGGGSYVYAAIPVPSRECRAGLLYGQEYAPSSEYFRDAFCWSVAN